MPEDPNDVLCAFVVAVVNEEVLQREFGHADRDEMVL